MAAFQRWHAPLTQAGARLVVARGHGFPTWAALRRHVVSLEDEDEPFARAYRAVESRDVARLGELLDRFPALVAARAANRNDLLGMATATGDTRLVALLLERGADPSRANVHGWTPLHQAGYVGLPKLARLLLDTGAPADVSARGAGGTPLVVALFWGHRATAEVLAEKGTFPRNLRTASGLGLLDVIDTLITPEGRLARDAGADRAFYRPHSGFPRWTPSDDPNEIIDEALLWAARNDRVDALDALVARGARIDADVYRGTALAWAAFCGRTRAIKRLLALGANPNRRTTFGGPEHGVGTTALHIAAGYGQLDAIEALLDGGADPEVRDELHHGTPASWAEYFGQEAAREALRNRGH